MNRVADFFCPALGAIIEQQIFNQNIVEIKEKLSNYDVRVRKDNKQLDIISYNENIPQIIGVVKEYFPTIKFVEYEVFKSSKPNKACTKPLTKRFQITDEDSEIFYDLPIITLQW